VKSLKAAQVTGSLSDYARDGLPEPVVVTKRGKPVLAVMPLTSNDDRESVSLATNAKFMEIIERSRASARNEGTLSLEEVRRNYARPRKPARRRDAARKR